MNNKPTSFATSAASDLSVSGARFLTIVNGGSVRHMNDSFPEIDDSSLFVTSIEQRPCHQAIPLYWSALALPCLSVL